MSSPTMPTGSSYKHIFTIELKNKTANRYDTCNWELEDTIGNVYTEITHFKDNQSRFEDVEALAEGFQDHALTKSAEGNFSEASYYEDYSDGLFQVSKINYIAKETDFVFDSGRGEDESNQLGFKVTTQSPCVNLHINFNTIEGLKAKSFDIQPSYDEDQTYYYTIEDNDLL